MTDIPISECIFHGSYSANLDACPICQEFELAGYSKRDMAKGETIVANASYTRKQVVESIQAGGRGDKSLPKQRGNKVLADGFTFDSAGEHRRYTHLLTLQTMGFMISHLEVHPKWELLSRVLLPKHFDKKSQTAISYAADFSYWYGGVFIIEDFKAKYGNSKRNVAKGIAGKAIVTDASRLRHKLLIAKLAAVYGDNFLFKIVTEWDESVML